MSELEIKTDMRERLREEEAGGVLLALNFLLDLNFEFLGWPAVLLVVHSVCFPTSMFCRLTVVIFPTAGDFMSCPDDGIEQPRLRITATVS